MSSAATNDRQLGEKPWGRLPAPGAAPITVEARRAGLPESRHAVRAVIADAAGRVVAAWGDDGRPVFARSAIKPIQSIPLVDTGAAAAFALDQAALALACASHNGEARHVAVVDTVLAKLGVDDTVLSCGAHWPYHEPTVHDMIRAGQRPRRAHNNCAGEHAGMLVTARHRDEPFGGYEQPDHPVQRRITAAVARLCGVREQDMPVGVDGCGAPALALPLAAMATGLARWGTPGGADAPACITLRDAILAEPLMIAGTGRLCSAVVTQSRGRAIAKAGAEGVYAAALPGRGLGLALKVADGTKRAAEAALILLLHHVDALDDAAIAHLGTPVISNWAGQDVGRIGVWPEL